METKKFCKKCEGTQIEILTGMSVGPVFGQAGTVRSYSIVRCLDCQHIMNREEEVTVDGFTAKD